MKGIPLSQMTMRDAERMEREEFRRAEAEHNGLNDFGRRVYPKHDAVTARPERTPQQLREWAVWARQRAVELQDEIDRGEQPQFRRHEVERYEKEAKRHEALADERENQ